MREILFRGKSPITQKWVYGDLFQHGEQRFIMADNRNTEVLPETVGQYTGLTDKNAAKIFEGDIVKTKYGRHCKVTWFSSRCYVQWDLSPVEDKHEAPDYFDIWDFKNLEVIGNIYDNPELAGGVST